MYFSFSFCLFLSLSLQQCALAWLHTAVHLVDSIGSCCLQCPLYNILLPAFKGNFFFEPDFVSDMNISPHHRSKN